MSTILQDPAALEAGIEPRGGVPAGAPAVDTRPRSYKYAKVLWQRTLPFVVMHAACLLVLVVGWSPVAVGVAALLYFARMFALTGFYHRYFSHRTYRTHRWSQFLFGVLGNTALQRGPLWWSAHHRHHHYHSDAEPDVHSPIQRGFWWSHMGWLATDEASELDFNQVRDLVKFRELVWLDRFHLVVPVLLAAGLAGLGAWLHVVAPGLHTGWAQMLVWGFFVSTVVLYHGTWTINSLSHQFGSVRYETGDDSRNNFLLALVTLGEGWHNNHHYFPGSTRQGFFWYEVDITYYLLKAMSWTGLVWELREPPERVLAWQTAAPRRRAQGPVK